MKKKKVEERIRKTVAGRVLGICGKDVKITIQTKVPDKWLFVDLEDSHIYMHSEYGGWKGVGKQEIKELLMVIANRR